MGKPEEYIGTPCVNRKTNWHSRDTTQGPRGTPIPMSGSGRDKTRGPGEAMGGSGGDKTRGPGKAMSGSGGDKKRGPGEATNGKAIL